MVETVDPFYRSGLSTTRAGLDRGSDLASARCMERGGAVNPGYRLIIVDQSGVLVSEFQLTENALAQPDTFVAAIKQAIEDVEEEEL